MTRSLEVGLTPLCISRGWDGIEWMNARLSLSLALGGGKFGARKWIGESGVRYTSSFFSPE